MYLFRIAAIFSTTQRTLRMAGKKANAATLQESLKEMQVPRLAPIHSILKPTPFFFIGAYC